MLFNRESDSMFLKISKFFLFIMLLYSMYLQPVLELSIPNMVTLLGLCVVTFIVLHFLYYYRISVLELLTPEIVLWFLFFLTSLIGSFFVSLDISKALSSLFQLAQIIVLLAIVVYISKSDGTIDFIVRSYIFIAILCAITLILRGYDVGGRMALSAIDNENTSGLLATMALVFSSLYFKARKPIRNIAIVLLILLFVYCIVLTGSRKSFIAAMLYIVYWLIFVLPEYNAKKNILKKVFIALIVLIAVCVTIYVLLPSFQESVLYIRLYRLFTSSDNMRYEMYQVAWQLFKESPILGIGYDNFRIYYWRGLYSHSTFAELLSCTGLVGTTIFISMFIMMTVKILKIIRNPSISRPVRIQAKVFLGDILVLVFLAFGLIEFYTLSDSFRFGIIYSFIALNYIPRMETNKSGEAEYCSKYIKA